MQYNSSKFSQNINQDTEQQELEQYFGDGNLFEQQKIAGGAKSVVQVKKEKVEYENRFGFVDAIPINGKVGYIVFLATLSILFIWFFFSFQVSNAFGTLILAIISFIVYRKVSFDLPKNFPHYLSNATITWKAMLRQIKPLRELTSKGIPLVYFSIIVFAVQKFVLDFILPASFSSLISGLNFFLFILAISFVFGHKQYVFLSQALKLQAILCMLELLFNGFFFGWYYGHTMGFAGFSFLFFWTLSVFAHEASKLNEKEKKETTIVINNKTNKEEKVVTDDINAEYDHII